MKNYLKWIKKTGGTKNENSLVGWINADEFVTGLKAAGPNFTQQKVVDATNAITKYTAGGIVPPINWTTAHQKDVECFAVEKVVNGGFKPVFGKKGKPFVCFPEQPEEDARRSPRSAAERTCVGPRAAAEREPGDVTDLIGYVIRGIPFGCVFALVAIGLVLTYKTSGVFNLAFAAQAFVSAAVYYQLRVDDGWPNVPAFLVAVVVVAPLLGLVLERFIFRHLRTAPAVAKLVASLGLLVALPEIVKLWIGSDAAYGVPTIWPNQFGDLPLRRLRDRRQRGRDGHRHGDLGGRR